MTDTRMYFKTPEERGVWLDLVSAALRGGANEAQAAIRADYVLREYRARCGVRNGQ